jgi:hypothetical protein
MTQYDVYGLGNALLDIECEVSPATLQDLGIEKGVMTLADEATQQKILSNLAVPPTKRACGGSKLPTMNQVNFILMICGSVALPPT